MGRIPFSVYDFFGYLAAGFLLLVAIDHAFDGGWLIGGSPGAALGLFWALAAYVLGQVIADLAGYVLERRLVRERIGAPEVLLLEPTRGSRLTASFREPLPEKLRERVRARVREAAAIEEPGRDLFLHCHAAVRHDPGTSERLATFLNLYGFARNTCMAAALAVPVLVAGSIRDAAAGALQPEKLLWTVAALVAVVGMFSRFLMFLRLYTIEVFTAYAERE